MRFRLLALDLDGTLLDPAGALRPRVREAVSSARARGLHVVVCTGRRYRTALPFLRELALEGPVVLHNGVVTKNASTGETVRHAYLGHALYREVVPLLERGFGAPLVYVDHPQDENLDIFCGPAEGAHPFQAEYLADNASVAREVHALSEPPSDALVMLSCIGQSAALASLRRTLTTRLGSRVRTHLIENKNYSGHILEALSPGAGKWPALRAVARAEGISDEEILAIGDDENDADLLRGAGLGVAMGNARASLVAVADEVTATHAEDGAAVAIERHVLGD